LARPPPAICQTPKAPPNFSWLALDSQDNAPIRFLGYLIAALQQAAPGLGANVQRLLQSAPTTPLDDLMTLLVNDLARFPASLVLILDDYHLIHQSAIHQALTFLIDHSPASVHLVITTRADPPLPDWPPSSGPLSERELEVLRLVAAGCSDREIADALVVVVGTTKRHLNNIYGKVKVHSRTQALARARELGLL
jgi:ATP/maltotriose-dependent transcriptional regulator MalT